MVFLLINGYKQRNSPIPMSLDMGMGLDIKVIIHYGCSSKWLLSSG